MPNPLYTSLASLSNDLLTQFGQAITIRSRSSVYDPATMLNTPDVITDTVVQGVVAPYAKNRIDGSLIKAGDMNLTIAAKFLTFVPDPSKHSVIFGSDQEWKIVRVDQINPAGTPVVYQLQVRAGA